MHFLDFPSSRISDDALINLPPIAIARLAGENDSDTLSRIANEWLAHRDWLYTLAVMCAPSDSSAVAAFGEALASDELYHALDLLRDIDGLADHVDVKPVLIDVSGKPLPPHNVMLEVAERDDPLA